MYFFGKIYRSSKMLAASLGSIGSVLAIVYGVLMSGGTVFIIGGSLCLVNSIFNFLDIAKVDKDIKKQVDNLKKQTTELSYKIQDFEHENQELHQNVTDLTDLKEVFIEKNTELQITMNSSLTQLETLEDLKDEYLSANRDLEHHLEEEKNQLVRLEDRNSELEGSLQKMINLKSQFGFENNRLKALVNQGQEQVEALDAIKARYLCENQKMAGELEDMSDNNEQLKGQITYLDDQVVKLRSLYQDSKKLLLNLATAGDLFNQFSDSIDTTIVRLDDTQEDLDITASTLHNLVEKLGQSSFKDLDIDEDGIVTEEEFQQAVQNL